MTGSTVNRPGSVNSFLLLKIAVIIMLASALIVLLCYSCDAIVVAMGQKRLHTVTNNLVQKIDTFAIEYLTESVSALALSHEVIQLCAGRSEPDNPRLSSVLTTTRSILGVSLVYVMDANGLVIGSSSDEEEKLSGQTYSFAPYFRRAMAGKTCRFPAIGVTTTQKGVYFSAPVYDNLKRTPTGVVVIKTTGASIDAFFTGLQGGVEALLVSSDGVVFSASRQEWIHSLAASLPDGRLPMLQQSRQFGEQPLPVLPFDLAEKVIRYDDMRAVTVRGSLSMPGWEVVTLSQAPFPLAVVLAISSFVFILMVIGIGSVIRTHREQCLGEKGRLGMLSNTEVEAERRKTQQELESIFSTILIGIALVRDNRIVQVNQRMCDMFGYSMQEIMHGNVWDFFISKEAFHRFIRQHYKTLPSAVVEQVECYLQKKDGSFIPCMVSGKSLHPDDSSQGSVWVVEDLSKRKEIEKALESAREQAETANVAKSVFLANMSHEIRTPMNGIIGLTKLVRQQTENREHQRHLGLIVRAANRLLSIINDILDYSKLEAGRSHVCVESFNPRETLTETLTPFQVLADRKNLDLTWSVDPRVPETVQTDQSKVIQIVTNLVDNAIKFTHQGGVQVSMRMHKQQQQEGGCLFVEVCDTGVGIALEHHSNIFNSFSQVDTSFTRQVGGSGLGLSITQGLVHMLGGDLWLDSELGNGAQFYFTLPVSAPDDATTVGHVQNDAHEQEREVADSGASAQVLVCEDEYISTVLIRTLLEEAGHTVTVAANGLEAIDHWRKKRFACIIMDIQMPEMDGFEAVRTIRNLEQGPRVPIIAITAHATEMGRAECLEAGMNFYLPKPIDGKDVLRLIEQCTDTARQK
ncbi:MAG: hypothetical protein CSA33_06335 [Desulfobulbus propionicus]|nr:MAG: hypothetical protein CSA33_06335 [Desulfobulbus propionicus]